MGKARINVLFFYALVLSCLSYSCTSYYQIVLENDCRFYQQKDTLSEYTILPASTTVYVTHSKRFFRKVKFDNRVGWSINPYFSRTGGMVDVSRQSSFTKRNKYRTPSSESSAGKTVNVKGYYRKNGTYVRPHTRSAPRSRK